MGKSCGNPNCSVSTGIHEGLTFGSGELDDYGYWQYPCRICAEDWDKTMLERIIKAKESYRADGMSEEDIAKKFSVEEAFYLYVKAWPFKANTNECTN